MHHEESFSALADWAFSNSDDSQPRASSRQGSFHSHGEEPRIDEKRSFSISFSTAPLEQVLPDELPQSDSPTSPRIDLCKLAALSPQEEAELCSTLNVDVPPLSPAWPECNTRKRSRGEGALSQQHRQRTGAPASGSKLAVGDAGAAEDEGAVRRNVMSMNVLMQLELQSRIYRLLLAQRQELLQPNHGDSTSTTRQQVLHVETMKGLILQQRMVQHLSGLVNLEDMKARGM